MSELKYLQIDSNYRNRNVYSKQSFFNIKSNTADFDSLGDIQEILVVEIL